MNKELAIQAINLYRYYCDLFAFEAVPIYPCDFPFYEEYVYPSWCEELLSKDEEFFMYLSIALHVHYLLASDYEAEKLHERIEADMHYEYDIYCDCHYSMDYRCPCCSDYYDEAEEVDW